MNNEISDYIPFMDQYPELKLRPTAEFPSHSVLAKFDYVQDLKLIREDAPHGYFYLIVKDGFFGVYMYDPGCFFSTNTIALKPKYKKIDIFYYEDKHFKAVVKKDGKYGMIIWTYNRIFPNDIVEIPAIYDSFVKIDGKRFKAKMGKQVTYIDFSGQILK